VRGRRGGGVFAELDGAALDLVEGEALFEGGGEAAEEVGDREGVPY